MSRVGAKVDEANRKLDQFVTLSQEQFEMISLIEVRSNLMPYTFVIMPEVVERKGWLGWLTGAAMDLVWSRSRLRFICPVTNQCVGCGPGPQSDGYPINIPHEWVGRLAPALHYGMVFLKVMLATEGLGGMIDLSKLTGAGGLASLTKAVERMNLLPGVEAALGDAPADYLSDQIDQLVQYAAAPPDEDATQALELVFRFLAHAELDGKDPYPGWKPQLMGLVLTTPPGGWVAVGVARGGGGVSSVRGGGCAQGVAGGGGQAGGTG